MVLVVATIILAFICNLIFPVDAHAYLDPNAGGFFLQVVIPIVFGAAATVTVFWRRMIGKIKSFISLLRGKSSSSREE